jgi:hypothetical protein
LSGDFISDFTISFILKIFIKYNACIKLLKWAIIVVAESTHYRSFPTFGKPMPPTTDRKLWGGQINSLISLVSQLKHGSISESGAGPFRMVKVIMTLLKFNTVLRKAHRDKE